MKRTDSIQFIKPTKGRNLPLMTKKNMVLMGSDFPLNISSKLSFVKWFVLLPFIGKFFLSERNQEFLFVDYLIFGDNPVLNAILLRKILDKAIFCERKFTVGIVQQTDFDYWGYHYYKKNELVFKKLLDEISNFNHPLLNIIQIRNNFDVAYFRRQSVDFGSYHFFLTEKNNQIHFIEKSMPNLAKAQRRLKESMLWEVNSIFRHMKNVHQLFFEKTKYGEFNHLICNKVFYTNYQPWLNHEINVTSYLINRNDHDQATITTTLFRHKEFEHQSFGSAYYLPDSFAFLEDFIYIDIERTKKLII